MECSSNERLAQVRRRLLRWGRAHFQEYLWRQETDPWLTLVAEILLQRTRASQVEPVFREVCYRYPTALALVRAGPAAVREITDKVGLHWRGDLLYRVAQSVHENGGKPPEEMVDLRRLPGVGMYTAAAWLSLHRGKRAAMVDSNVARWLSRMTGKPYPRDPRHVDWVQNLADCLTPKRSFRDYNYAVLDFTMAICTPRSPRCGECPVRQFCWYGSSNSPMIESNRQPEHRASIDRSSHP